MTDTLKYEIEALKAENDKLRAALHLSARPGGPHMQLLSSYTQSMQRLALYEHGMNEMEKRVELFSPEARTQQAETTFALRVKTYELWAELEFVLRPYEAKKDDQG